MNGAREVGTTAEAGQDQAGALEPPQILQKAVEEGVESAGLKPDRMIVLGLLTGAAVALGGLFSTTVASGGEGVLPYGTVRFLAGLVFALGLALVVVSRAELFTGNTLMVVAWAQGEVTARRILTNWAVVYAANFAGSLAIAGLVCVSGQYLGGDGAVGQAPLTTANAKVQLTFTQAVASGILANFLVCLAVWLTYSARTTTGKVVALLLPNWAFVAAEVEHSVANMYLVPIGLFIKGDAPERFWTAIDASPTGYPDLTWVGFLLDNLLPSTIGNVIGGSVLVGLAYWYAYR